MTGASYEPFDNGFMIWTVWNQQVYVFYYMNGGELSGVPLSEYGPLPDNPVTDPTPPGHVRPILGFGRVWGNYGFIRQWLGWALTAEQGYTATIIQSTLNVNGDGIGFKITVPDGRTVTIVRTSWHFLSQTSPQ